MYWAVLSTTNKPRKICAAGPENGGCRLSLACGLAHDFNNLMMGIQGLTSLMLLDTKQSIPITPS